MRRARILLADDHALTRKDLSAVLAPNYEIVGSEADGRALVKAALRLKPDLIVVDITMPLLSGIEAARQIRKKLPDTKLLFVTMHSSSTYVKAAFEAGATGYVLKSAMIEELLHAVQSVLSGRAHISAGITADDLERLQHPVPGPTPRFSKPARNPKTVR